VAGFNSTNHWLVLIRPPTIIMSFFKNEVPAGTRINLKWPDKHEVTDFKLGQLGELVSCETETDQTKWVIAKSHGNIQIGDKIPLL